MEDYMIIKEQLHLQKSITQSKESIEQNDTACVTKKIKSHSVKGN